MTQALADTQTQMLDKKKERSQTQMFDRCCSGNVVIVDNFFL